MGMLRSARWLMTHELPRITDLLTKHPGHSFRLIGHSLGAGTLSLLAMMLRVRSCCVPLICMMLQVCLA